MKHIYILAFTVISFFTSCEKDDICDANTPTTPRVVLEFYDFTNPSALKKVENLKITGAGMTASLGNFDNVDKIRIPLKTDVLSTTFQFEINSTDSNKNEDLLQFNYIKQDIFVSRACGFKTIFELTSQNPVIKSDASIPDGFWIKDIIINKSNIDNENETHIKIYF